MPSAQLAVHCDSLHFQQIRIKAVGTIWKLAPIRLWPKRATCTSFKALRSGNAWAARGRIRRALGLATMEVGADEFEQSLPLLQELVAGADFVGKVPGVAGSVIRVACRG